MVRIERRYQFKKFVNIHRHKPARGAQPRSGANKHRLFGWETQLGLSRGMDTRGGARSWPCWPPCLLHCSGTSGLVPMATAKARYPPVVAFRSRTLAFRGPRRPPAGPETHQMSHQLRTVDARPALVRGCGSSPSEVNITMEWKARSGAAPCGRNVMPLISVSGG